MTPRSGPKTARSPSKSPTKSPRSSPHSAKSRSKDINASPNVKSFTVGKTFLDIRKEALELLSIENLKFRRRPALDSEVNWWSHPPRISSKSRGPLDEESMEIEELLMNPNHSAFVQGNGTVPIEDNGTVPIEEEISDFLDRAVGAPSVAESITNPLPCTSALPFTSSLPFTSVFPPTSALPFVPSVPSVPTSVPVLKQPKPAPMPKTENFKVKLKLEDVKPLIIELSDDDSPGHFNQPLGSLELPYNVVVKAERRSRVRAWSFTCLRDGTWWR